MQDGDVGEVGRVFVPWVLECGVKVVVIKKKNGCEAY